MNGTQHRGYRIYWITWGILLAFTLGMLVTGWVALPKWSLVFLLVVGMLVKVSLIGANFMHLRFEKPALVVSVAVGILVTAALLFFLIAVDGVRVLELAD